MDRIFNFVEAGLWTSIALALLVRSRGLEGKQRKVTSIAAGAFFLFGISDVVEAYTGTWWKPLWLLLLKGSCILSFVVCLAYYIKNKD